MKKSILVQPQALSEEISIQQNSLQGEKMEKRFQDINFAVPKLKGT